jgi:predicted metal-dependent phosphoesterase TrpH
MNYILDTHVHTREVSPCSDVSAKDMIDVYIKNGYDGVIITDHYYIGLFENILGSMSWERKIHSYLRGFAAAKEYASGKGIDVFPAIELTLTHSKRDYLIYGITEDFLMENQKLYNMSISEFRELADKNDLFIVQAHPFRPFLDPPEHEYLDAVEVFNGNMRHDSNNGLALEYAEKYGLPGSSGSDFHKIGDAATGGMILPRRIKDLSEYIWMLKENAKDIELIKR